MVCHHSNPASARKVDEPWTKCRNPTDVDWTRALAHDGRDPRSWPRTKPCRGQHVLEQSYTANQHGAWISCARCALRLHYIPRHTARMTSVSTPSSASVQEALKRMSLWRDNDFTTKAVKGHDCRGRGRKPPRKARCSLTKKISDDFAWSSSDLIIRLYFLVGVRHRHRCERGFLARYEGDVQLLVHLQSLEVLHIRTTSFAGPCRLAHKRTTARFLLTRFKPALNHSAAVS